MRTTPTRLNNYNGTYSDVLRAPGLLLQINREKEVVMEKDDYFRVVFCILKAAYEYKKAHMRFDEEEISPDVLGINEGYRDEILEEMLEEGYIKGITVKKYISGSYISGFECLNITPKGIEYLNENSNMKKVYVTLKETRGLLPGM